MSEPSNHMEETADIIAAFVSNNSISAAELPELIRTVHQSFAKLGQPVEDAKPEHPRATAAQIRKSITPEGLISFEDGKAYKSLKRHLSTKGLSPDEYRAKHGLPKDYPMVAASYSAKRSELAKNLGLGRKAQPEPAETPTKRRKAA